MIKRLADIIGSVIGVLILGLPMLLIALAIRLETSGSAIFRQRRVGLRGRPFVMFKFRTMRADAEPYGSSPRSAEDARLTKVGRWLREKSLDELPQLFNILAGQMSLVGPRPLYERQAALWDERQKRRLDVRPGLTGYAQVYGRGAISHEEKIELDIEYVDNRTLLLDAKIILKTVKNIANPLASRTEIYEHRYSHQKERED